jgi:glycine/D-amino acid oxidase-like deaminating enzyme
MAREVVVVGAGIVGAATARELAVRGVDVLLLDAGDVSSGTTGLGEGNVLCSDKDAGPELDLCVAGRALFDELGEEARIRRKGALVVHPDAATWAAEPARLARLRDAGVEGRMVAADEVVELEPLLTGPVHGATFFPDDLQCDPRAIARALALEVPDVRTGARVTEIATAPAARIAGVVLESGERIAAGAVVLAAGPWSASLAATAGIALPVEPRKGQLVRLAGPADVRHKVVDGSYLASVISDGAGLEITTVVETTWEGEVLVGSSRERRGFDTAVDEAVSEAMVARAARLFPSLSERPHAAAWAGLRPWLPDHLPAIGPSAAVEGLWAATGHEGAGVALGPITGRLVAQAYCGEPLPLDLAPFAPDRFSDASSRRSERPAVRVI